MAIAYLKHPESHITQLNLNTTLMNITMENERDEKITQVIQKASLSKLVFENDTFLKFLLKDFLYYQVIHS